MAPALPECCSVLVRPAALPWLDAIRSEHRLDTWGEAARVVLAAVFLDDQARQCTSTVAAADVPRAPRVYGRARTHAHNSRISIDLPPDLARHLARVARRSGLSIPNAAAGLLEAVRVADSAVKETIQ